MPSPPARERGDPDIQGFLRYLSVEREASEHTLKNYLMDIGQFIAVQWGEETAPPFRWAEVDRFGARAFLVAFQKRGSLPATTRRKLSSLRSFFKYLVREDRVAVNPFVGISLPKMTRRLPKLLSKDEVLRLVSAPLRTPPGEETDPVTRLWQGYARTRDAAILETLYSTGARISELTGLNDTAVDLLAGVIKVRGKGKKERLCLLGRPAIQCLRAMLEQREALWQVWGNLLDAGAENKSVQRLGRAVSPLTAEGRRLATACNHGAQGTARPTFTALDDMKLTQGEISKPATHLFGIFAQGGVGVVLGLFPVVIWVAFKQVPPALDAFGFDLHRVVEG
jgi:site-specific recombinase XerD